jgi:hypothetical protein
MPVTGSIPLSKIQGDLETTRGTAIAATRVLPIISGTMEHHKEEVEIEEQRGSLIGGYYKPLRVREWVELDLDLQPTEQDIIWWLQLGLRGHSTQGTALAASVVSTSVDRYTYQPTPLVGLTQTATLEVGDDTQAYIVTGCVVDRLEFGWSLGGPMTLKAHVMAFKAVGGSYTAAQTAKGTEVFNGALAKAYIDTSTIGSSLVTAPSAMTFSIDNQVALFYAPDGGIIATDFYHRRPRRMALEATIRHTADTENAAFLAQTTRKIRTIIEGSAIAASSPSTNRSVTVDWYGTWSSAPFSDEDGLRAQRMSGSSILDTTATHDWSVIVDTDTATIV